MIKKITLKFFSLWLPLVLWCSIIFYLSSLPHLKTELGVWDLVLRKCAHVFEYAVLFILARRAFADTKILGSFKTVNVASVVFSFLYAASDEFHQGFVPGRGPSIIDVGIDTIGVFAGLIIYYFWHKKCIEK